MQLGVALYILSLQRKHLVNNIFCCPECKEDFVLEKHKNKYDVYDIILEDFVDIPFKLLDRIGQNLKDLDGEEDSEHEYDPKCLECSICNFTLRWQNGLRADVKSMLNDNSVVSNVSGDIEALRNFKNTLITSIRKTLTSLKYYKNVSVISEIGVV